MRNPPIQQYSDKCVEIPLNKWLRSNIVLDLNHLPIESEISYDQQRGRTRTSQIHSTTDHTKYRVNQAFLFDDEADTYG